MAKSLIALLVLPGLALGAEPVAPATEGSGITNGDVVVTARGATAERALADRFAEQVNVRDFGAIGDGVADDTGAFQAAYAAVRGNGGTIVVPRGTYRMNLLVDADRVRIEGAGSGNVDSGLAATSLRPGDPTVPVLQVGGGLVRRQGITIRDLALVGTGAGGSSDGLVVRGAQGVTVDGVIATGFGRDNVRIESTPTASSFAIWFSNFHTSAARRSGFRAEYGPGFVTAIFAANAHFNGWNAPGATAIHLDSVRLGCSGCYVDVPGDAVGHVVLERSWAPEPALELQGGEIDDAGGAGAVAVELPFARTPTAWFGRWVSGELSIAGSIRLGERQVPAAGMSGSKSNLWLEHPMVFHGLDFPAGEAGAATGTADVQLRRTGERGAATLAVEGARVRAPALVTGRVTPVFAERLVIDAAAGNEHVITATRRDPFRLEPPINPAPGQRITIRIRNASGGPLGAVSWHPVFRLSPWTSPGPASSRAIDFQYDGASWVEVSRTPADVPDGVLPARLGVPPPPAP
ncbi:MAG: glycosyl hydrolase family 28-related protein [Anaeromyxobacteraceae bacterium]